MASTAPSPPIETDALVVGAGPAGLFQVFQLGLLEIHAHVVDALPHAGGQCVELYADKPIYDIPSVLMCTGRELTDKLLRQIEPMRAHFHWGQLVSEVSRQADGRFLVTTSSPTRFLARTVFIAGGVGAFSPKRLNISALATFEGAQLDYHVADAAVYAGQRVVVMGDGDSALEWALRLCPGNDDGFAYKAAHVTLLHRRDVLNAAAPSVAHFHSLVNAGHIDFAVGQITGVENPTGRLDALEITQADATVARLPLDRLLVLQGLSPKLGPIGDWGLAMERRQLLVNAENCATSEPGIFAVGDINTYPAKKKLILCAFHECVQAAFGAAAYLHPERKTLLEYTTTSSRLHKVLGLA